jgi:protein dithiol oxidoreductase (disulfide-forming)
MEIFMRNFASLIAALGLMFATSVGAVDLQQGREYDLVNPPQMTSSPGKIEVIEFFSYACPHCAHLEPALSAWLKKLPADVAFRRIPLTGGPAWIPTAKLFYALDAMGMEDHLHSSVFDAIHGSHSVVPTDESSIAAWATKNGIEATKFSGAYGSFSVQSKVLQAQQNLSAYGVSGVPAMIVDGRFRVRNEAIANYDDLLAFTDALIARVRSERAKK